MYRASELGSCVRALVAKQLGLPENPVPANVQGWFDRGNAHEEECIAALNFDEQFVRGQQEEVKLVIADGLSVIGHLDGYLADKVLEVKAPQSWAKWRDAQWRGDYSDPLMSRYAWQISVYMAATGMEALIACLDDEGVKTFGIEIAPIRKEQIQDRVRMVEALVRANVRPECTSRDFPCPFFPRECTHAKEEIAFDPVLDALAQSYSNFKELEKLNKAGADKVRQEMLDHLGDRDAVATDNVKVTRFSTTRTTFDRKAAEADFGDLSRYDRTSKSVTLKVTKRETDAQQ